MENASKALIMAGTILISVMILSIAVSVINMFGEYAASQEEERVNQQTAEFNAQFLKYEGQNDITAQQIVTVANLAKANNDFYEFDPSSPDAKADENKYYIEVDIQGKEEDFEKKDKKEEFLENEDNVVVKNSGKVERLKYYTTNGILVSPVTKRVYKITFKEIP